MPLTNNWWTQMLAPSFILTKANNGSRHGDQYLNINDLTLIFLSGEEKRGYESVVCVCVCMLRETPRNPTSLHETISLEQL